MKLYFKYMKTNLKSEMQYKTSFIMSILSQVFIFFGYYFTIICLFDKFSNVKGFTLYEVLFTFSVVQFGYSFCEVFFRGVDLFDELIIRGEFDKILIRPRSILLQVFSEKMQFSRLSKVLEAIIILIISIIKMNVVWNFNKLLVVIFVLFSSVILFLSIFLVAASYCFITIKGLEVRNLVTDGGKQMAQYPIGIFKKGFIVFFTFIIPFGLINYYPLLYILDKNSSILYMFSPLFTIIYFILSMLIFYKGVKRYTSVGC